ncbi:serine hydrolase domain-containing protein [Pedobacter lithocola]|uniref:Serine hydrolase domain-containing protein n=1 Tax=Pedobacter lithocola TaxID=1908239 RepID=A0ABV8PEG2_9SPHI
MKGLLCITIVLLITLTGRAQTPKQQSLDAYIDHLFKNKKMMGNVEISFKDSIIYAKSVGFSNVTTAEENNKNTKFRVGSLTKTYTAVLVLKAIEEGQLQLNDKLSSFYLYVKNAEKITIEQLLKHWTGIYNYTEIADEDLWEQKFHTEEEFINYLINEKSNFEPGTKYEYSNTNYAFLGFILQKIYNKPFAEILKEKICCPLYLKNTYFSVETDRTKNEALSYNIQDRYIVNAKVNFSVHFANGGIASTAIEVDNFLTPLFNGKLISAKSLEMMLPKNKGEYGMGIEKLPFDNPQGYTHNGRIENYFSEYWYFPKEKLGIVTLLNATNIYTSDIQTLLLQYAYGNKYEIPNSNQTDEILEKDFKQIKGTYFEKDKKAFFTISSDGKNMVFQASDAGQMFVRLEYEGNNIFEYEDMELQFFPSIKEAILTQGNIIKKYKKLSKQ